MSFNLPVAKDVRDLFESLLGRPITVGPADPVLAGDMTTMLVSLYLDDARQLAAVVGMDLPLTVYAGSAIGLLPPGGAQDCVADGEVTPAVAENAKEVCNVMASLFNRDGGGHLRLHQTFPPGEPPPGDAGSYLLALGRRIDLTVEVGGYGSGKLAVALTGPTDLP